jgi:hypothetical protein
MSIPLPEGRIVSSQAFGSKERKLMDWFVVVVGFRWAASCDGYHEDIVDCYFSVLLFLSRIFRLKLRAGDGLLRWIHDTVVEDDVWDLRGGGCNAFFGELAFGAPTLLFGYERSYGTYRLYCLLGRCSISTR